MKRKIKNTFGGVGILISVLINVLYHKLDIITELFGEEIRNWLDLGFFNPITSIIVIIFVLAVIYIFNESIQKDISQSEKIVTNKKTSFTFDKMPEDDPFIQDFCGRENEIEILTQNLLEQKIKKPFYHYFLSWFFIGSAIEKLRSLSKNYRILLFFSKNKEQQKTCIAVITGIGGVGKTTLARKIANQKEIRRKYPDGCYLIDMQGIFENQAMDNKEALSMVIRKLLEVESQEITISENTDEDTLSKHYSSILKKKRVLIILDNPPSCFDIRFFKPPSSSALLVVSRPHIVFQGPEITKVHINPFTTEESRKLLRYYSQTINNTFNDAIADKICELCGNLPLAIYAAGRILGDGIYTPEEYKEKLENTSKQIPGSGKGRAFFSLFGKLPDKKRRDIPTVFRLSYELLTDEQKKMFRCTGIFPQKAFFEENDLCAVAGISQDQFIDLVTHRLIEQFKKFKPTRYNLYDLLRLYAIEELEKNRNEILQVRMSYAKWYVEKAEKYSENIFWRNASQDIVHIEYGQQIAASEEPPNGFYDDILVRYARISQYILGMKLDNKVLFLENGITAAERLKKSSIIIAEVIVILGNVYRNDGQEELAIKTYTKAIEKEKDYAEAFFNRGLAYFFLDQYDNARVDFDQAITLNLNNIDVYHYSGWTYIYLRNYDKAQKDFTAAIKIAEEPSNLFLILKLPNLYDYRGYSYLKLGCFDEAISDFSQAIKLGLNQSETYYFRGVAYEEIGNKTKSREDFEKAISINPKTPSSHYYCGLAYKKLRKFNQAIEELTKAIDLHFNKKSWAYYHRGLAHKELGNIDESIADCKQAIKFDEKYFEAYYNLGIAYIEKKQYLDAIQTLNDALNCYSSDHQTAQTHYFCGIAYVGIAEQDSQNIQHWEYERALYHFTKAISIKKRSHLPYYEELYRCGFIYLTLNQQEDGKNSLQEAYNMCENKKMKSEIGTLLKRINSSS
jgi:tetratricopeptide (TPR) repeat protein